MVAFNQIPNDWRVPLAYVEFDASNAGGAAVAAHRCLLIGQRLTTGAVAELVPTRITSDQQAINAFGQHSMLAQMVKAYRKANTSLELWAIALDDLVAGVKATGTITITGPATADGILNVYIAKRRLQVAVTSGDSATTIAAAIVSAIGAHSDMPVTAANSSGVVTLTARHKGKLGNGIDVRVNFNSDDVTPAGVTVAIVAMGGGVAGDGNPDLQDVVDTLGDERFKTIVNPYSDAANLTVCETEMADRWGPMRPIDGWCITAGFGSLSTHTTLGDSRNSAFTIIADGGVVLDTPWEVAAVVGGASSLSLSIDPARPLNTVELPGLTAKPVAERRTMEEQNTLLYSGISPLYVDAGGVVRIQELITTYKTNALGADDEAYLYLNTVATLSYLREDWRNTINTEYPRYKLAKNGTRIAPGSKVVTPSRLKARAVAKYREWEVSGLVEDVETFKSTVVVEINATNPNRVDILMPPDLINGLRMVATSLGFKL